MAGVAGEYYVAGKLSSLGYVASITMRNTRGIDILCSNADASKTVAIQVKTNRTTKREWLLSVKAEEFVQKDHYIVFVCLNNNESAPDFFVVPSAVVAKQIKEEHVLWLATPGRNGHQHNDNSMRRFTDQSEEYKGRWDLLGLDV